VSFSSFGLDLGQFFQGVTSPTSGTRVRGLVAPGATHDFFTTGTPIDTYNSERFTFASGPNSILFGLGNPAGVIDTSFKRAQLDRRFAETQVRGDSEGSLRSSLDINAPIVRDRLGLRMALLRDHAEVSRNPNFSHDHRGISRSRPSHLRIPRFAGGSRTSIRTASPCATPSSTTR